MINEKRSGIIPLLFLILQKNVVMSLKKQLSEVLIGWAILSVLLGLCWIITDFDWKKDREKYSSTNSIVLSRSTGDNSDISLDEAVQRGREVLERYGLNDVSNRTIEEQQAALDTYSPQMSDDDIALHYANRKYSRIESIIEYIFIVLSIASLIDAVILIIKAR